MAGDVAGKAHQAPILRGAPTTDPASLDAARFLARHLGHYITTDLPSDAFTVAARTPDRIVGAAIARLLTHSDRARFAALHPALRAVCESPEPVGEMWAAAVDPDYTRQGIGTRLLDARLAWLRERGARYAVAESWHNPDRADARTLLARAGRAVVTIDRYWDGQECIRCGTACRCAATIFVLPTGTRER